MKEETRVKKAIDFFMEHCAKTDNVVFNNLYSYSDTYRAIELNQVYVKAPNKNHFTVSINNNTIGHNNKSNHIFLIDSHNIIDGYSDLYYHTENYDLFVKNQDIKDLFHYIKDCIGKEKYDSFLALLYLVTNIYNVEKTNIEISHMLPKEANSFWKYFVPEYIGSENLKDIKAFEDKVAPYSMFFILTFIRYCDNNKDIIETAQRHIHDLFDKYVKNKVN